MSKEVPLQMSFDGDLKDTRTRKQKRLTKQREGWQQSELFSSREVAQWGVRRRPMHLVRRDGSPLRMKLEIEDPRNEKEKERDRQREAEKLTDSLPAMPEAPLDEV
jgi:hypothetical protein